MIYDASEYKYAHFKKKKSVVHKSEPENCQFIDRQISFSGLPQDELNINTHLLKKK